MSKSVIFIFTALLLNGCSGGIQKAALATSAEIEDATLSRFQATDNFTPEDEKKVLTSNRDECADQGKDHMMADSRLTDGTKFTNVTQSSKAGTDLVRTIGEFDITSNTGGTLTQHRTFSRNDKTYQFDESCTPSGSGSLNCVLVGATGKTLGSMNACILVEDPQIVAKKTYSKGGTYTTDSDLKLSSFETITIERQGQIVCLGKNEGRGSSIEKTVYSPQVPSLTEDSCADGEVYRMFKLLNADGKTRETHSSEITSISYGQ
jgi:hypothetical protein